MSAPFVHEFGGTLKHDAEKWDRFSEKIMLEESVATSGRKAYRARAR
jgi:hypothetical protein